MLWRRAHGTINRRTGQPLAMTAILLLGFVGLLESSARAESPSESNAKSAAQLYRDLRQRAGRATDPSAVKSLVFDAFAAIDRAQALNDHPMAIRLAELASRMAPRSGSSHLVWLARTRQEQTKSVARKYGEVEQAAQKVESGAADPVDNFDFGRFLCLVQGDWQRGLRLLSRCDAPNYRKLAEAELNQPQAADARRRLGAAWAQLASGENGHWQQAMYARAYHWCRKALRQASGAQRQQVDRLMDELPFRYLTDMKESAFSKGAWQLGRYGDRGDGRPITVNGIKYENGLGLHPAMFGTASVKFTLNGNYETFTAAVAIADHNSRIRSPAVFGVLGDGRVLWKSQPIGEHGEIDLCRVSVKGVRTLELRTQSLKGNFGVHAVWLDPVVRK